MVLLGGPDQMLKMTIREAKLTPDYTLLTKELTGTFYELGLKVLETRYRQPGNKVIDCLPNN